MFAQKGKHGAKSITTTTAVTKVNEFTALTADANAGSTTINVTASSLNANSRFTSTLTPGDLVMVIQMQGALIKLSPVPVWAPDSTLGSIYSYEKCGNYEFAQVKSIPSSTSIEFDCGLTYSYSATGKTQVVRVPRYSSLNIAASATLTTDGWNSTTGIGGILAVEVDGNTTINSGALVHANGLGFRGGVAIGNGGTGNGNFQTKNPNDGAEKGEGIGSNRLTNSTTTDSLGKQCKSAPANGGGGGNANNCGGGGGANAGNINNWNGYGIANTSFSAIWDLEWPGRSSVTSSGGGKGGYGTATTTTPNINSVGPNDTRWGSFKRPNYGGFGGRPLDYSLGKIFMGGGGGAGHMSTNQSNGANACSGGNGGGIVYFLSYGTISGTGTISANGNNGNNAFGTANIINPTQGIDGAGGAGGGGTIILESTGNINSITTSANGGNGGNQIKSGTTNSEGQGPGGGGGGGYIASSGGGTFSQSANGGLYGTTNASAFDTEFPMNGATSGNVGLTGQSIISGKSYVQTLTTSANQTICANQSTTLSATSSNGTATVQWYSAATGGNAVATGSLYTTPTYTAAGTYTVYAGTCPGTYRQPITITVTSGLNISVNSATICPSQTAVLTLTTSATSYTWNTGATTNSISVSPSTTTIYTINATGSSCSGSQTVAVNVLPTPTTAVASQTICSNTTTTLTASGASSYTWQPGGQTTSAIIVTPSSNTTYTITGSNGTCTNSTTATVSVVTQPTVAVANVSVCSGNSISMSASGATNYTWQPGGATSTSISITPTATTIYTITGANGNCTHSITATASVVTTPTISVSNQTICPTQSITLNASGATSYSWNTGATSSSISVSPSSTTVYTVIGTSNGCASSKTVSVNVANQPTLAVNSSSTCSGNTVTLNVSGNATSYTWTPGNNTGTSINASPSTTTTYTIVGSNGTCSNTTTATLSITTTPTLTPVSATICPGQTATLSVSGATNYTWTPGAISGSSYTIAPASNTTVSILGANGTCTSQATASVTIGTGVSIAVNGATICAGQTANISASGVSSYTWNTGANTSSISVTPTTSTTYTVNGTSGSCSGTNTVEVVVVNQPTISVSSASICSGETTTLTANTSATSYTWSNTSNASAIAVTPSITTVYSVTASNGYCSVSTTATVDVTNTPTIAVASTTICPGQTATLTANGASSYVWNPGNITGNNYTIAPSSDVTVSVIGANNTCTAQATASVTIGSGISIAVNNVSICPNETATLTATSAASSYTWNTGANTNSITVTPTITTIYTVNASDNACAGTNTVMVTVNNAPSINVNGGNICSGNSATLTAAGTANTYTWLPGGQNSPSIIDNPSTTTTYTIIGSDGICTNTTTATLSVTTTPSLVVNSVTICTGQTATLIASGATDYTWTPGNITGNTYTISPSNSTTVDIVGANGTCSAQTTASITIGTGISISVNSATICSGESATLSATGVATSYTWSSGQNTSSITETPSVTTTYTLNGENNGCFGSTTASITVNTTPTITVTSNNICVGESVLIIANGANTYTWSNGVNGSSQLISPTVTTVFSVTGTSAEGCTNIGIVSTTVNVTPTPTINIIASPTICAGQSTTLVATGATSYTWNTSSTSNSITATPNNTTVYSVIGSNGGCTTSASHTISIVALPNVIVIPDVTSGCADLCVGFSGVANPLNSTISYTFGDGATENSNNNPTHCYTSAGVFTVMATATNSSGCSTTITLANPITVFANPTASFVISEGNTVEIGSTINLVNNSTNNNTNLWSFGDNTGSVATNPTYSYSNTGTYCIKLVTQSVNGCVDSTTNCIEIIKPISINIPNVFSPNNDGKNDVFKITGSSIKNFSCSIYDRWGLKLYEWSGINGGWDGNAKGGEAPSGTYFYILEYTDAKDQVTTEKGFLNLFRD